MNRIEVMIAELCPEGVEFKEIGELLERASNIRWQDVAGQEFQYIDLTSVDRNTSAIANTETIDSETAPSRAQQIVRVGDVIFGTTRPMLKRYCLVPAEYDGQICSTGYCVLRPKADLLLPSFLFHLLGTESFYSYVDVNQRGASYPAITDGAVKAFRIPVPPFEVQSEIVKVLDTFMGLEAELGAELEAELEARRRQYRYYRDALLAFSDQDIRWVAMAELGKFIRGRRFTKADYVEDGVPCIHYGEIYTRYGTAAESAISHVRSDMAASLRYAKPGDVVVTDVGETVEDVGKAVAWVGTEDVAIHDHCYAFRHSMNPKFVSYCMQTSSFIAGKAKYVARTKVNTLLIGGFSTIRIPVPTLEEQERIVAILDKFYALVNDISVGLPAEIAARRQQYTYYRDRLLTFKEAA
ncbi:restriction endonuclease subunit S [Pseudomonas sp. 14A]|uniref:restriction endonuclease subunit S n=1 Tax=Pseudomonas sp. 14A TaxID=2823142 RepID=UPI001B81DC17|nr:restriction endonuclease subunit S [Pseudomonas sp. 14A]MBR7195884.1 restriction endonuclease subunit S [Pseudomonas sp. 14A]